MAYQHHIQPQARQPRPRTSNPAWTKAAENLETRPHVALTGRRVEEAEVVLAGAVSAFQATS